MLTLSGKAFERRAEQLLTNYVPAKGPCKDTADMLKRHQTAVGITSRTCMSRWAVRTCPSYASNLETPLSFAFSRFQPNTSWESYKLATNQHKNQTPIEGARLLENTFRACSVGGFMQHLARVFARRQPHLNKARCLTASATRQYKGRKQKTGIGNPLWKQMSSEKVAGLRQGISFFPFHPHHKCHHCIRGCRMIALSQAANGRQYTGERPLAQRDRDRTSIPWGHCSNHDTQEMHTNTLILRHTRCTTDPKPIGMYETMLHHWKPRQSC